MKVLIVDGYVDEPAVLGVPPYVSPYVRYAYGISLLKNHKTSYITIDEIRKRDVWKFDADLLVIYGGTTVPGRYLSGTPITLSEVRKLLSKNRKATRVVAGPITQTYTIRGGTKAIRPEFDAEYVVKGDLWAFLKTLFDGEPKTGSRGDYDELKDIAVAGAELVRDHPFYPNVICEVELSSGCERDSFCSFCTEPALHGRLKSRKVEDVVLEVKALYEVGCRAFRLGRTANVVAYMADGNDLRPNPIAIEELYSGIREVAPELEVLHTDNANPSYITKNISESVKIIETIAKYNTPGDVLSFGAESFDEKVLKMNNIGSTPEEVFKAIEIVNGIGSHRVGGVPKLLPGINILHGLIGETEETFRKNYEFLKRVLDSGFLLRRINIRQVMVHPITPLFRYYRENRFKFDKRLFRYWKERIREDIDRPMLERVFPIGTVIRGVIPEKRVGNITFARPLGSYPILVGVPRKLDEKTDVVVVDHGRRSITAIRYPVDLNTVSFEELEAIRGIGKKRAEEIVMKRPFKSLEDARKRLSEETWKTLENVVVK